MKLPLLSIAALLYSPALAGGTLADVDINAPPHSYYERPLQDRFSRLKSTLDGGAAILERGSEKTFLRSVLRVLDIPESSQMLVFSTTSLQLSLISPANPRALYFNDDTYLGYIPGGKIEIISMDPELGAIFYIFDIPKGSAPLAIERSRRCMNCHAASETGYVPGLVIKSVIPGVRGGSIDAFRLDDIGHQIPIEERFGGWYLTGAPFITNHLANFIGHAKAGDITREAVTPGERFDFAKYPVATSDILPQLIHEHQAGFANRVLQAAYTARHHFGSAPTNSTSALPPEQSVELDQLAHELVRYILFADEAPLPATGVEGDPAYKAAFARNRRATADGASLKDFDLRTRMFKYRCSYMIYSEVLAALHPEMKSRVYKQLRDALQNGGEAGGHLPESERKAILQILGETLPDFTHAS